MAHSLCGIPNFVITFSILSNLISFLDTDFLRSGYTLAKPNKERNIKQALIAVAE